jgi:hypothetical protein
VHFHTPKGQAMQDLDDTPLRLLVDELHKKHKGDDAKIKRELTKRIEADEELSELLARIMHDYYWEKWKKSLG